MRASAVLALALGAAACSSTRAYEGPQRGEHEVAVLTEYPDGMGDFLGGVGSGLLLQSVWHTRIVGVDDHDVEGFWRDGDVEVLPGRHTVRAALILKNGTTYLQYPTYVASFEALAGHVYQLRGRHSTLPDVIGFDVWDVESDTIVGSSDARPEECVSARLDWGGTPWTQADWGRTASITTTSYVPPGQALSSWREIVELQYLPARAPLDLDEVQALKLEDLRQVADDAVQTPLESGPDLRVFTWSAAESDGQVQQGVTCLRNGPRGCHVLLFATRGVLEPSVAAVWVARFKAAALTPPEL